MLKKKSIKKRKNSSSEDDRKKAIDKYIKDNKIKREEYQDPDFPRADYEKFLMGPANKSPYKTGYKHNMVIIPEDSSRPPKSKREFAHVLKHDVVCKYCDGWQDSSGEFRHYDWCPIYKSSRKNPKGIKKNSKRKVKKTT